MQFITEKGDAEDWCSRRDDVFVCLGRLPDEPAAEAARTTVRDDRPAPSEKGARLASNSIASRNFHNVGWENLASFHRDKSYFFSRRSWRGKANIKEVVLAHFPWHLQKKISLKFNFQSFSSPKRMSSFIRWNNYSTPRGWKDIAMSKARMIMMASKHPPPSAPAPAPTPTGSGNGAQFWVEEPFFRQKMIRLIVRLQT